MAYVPFRAMRRLARRGYAREAVTRRDCIVGVSEGIAAGGLLAWLYSDSETEANRFLRQLPEDIPGACSVAKYETPESRHCLVHVRQTHFGTTTTIDENAIEDIRIMNTVQSNIYQVLLHLIRNAYLRHVYDEGIAIETEYLYRDFAEFMNRYLEWLDSPSPQVTRDLLKRRMQLLQKYLSNSTMRKMEKFGLSSLYRQMEDELEFLRRPLDDKQIFDYFYKVALLWRLSQGATGQLVLQGKLSVKPAEKEETHIRGLEELYRGKFGEAQEAREDFLLDLISESGDTGAVTVYGATHSWNDNVEIWNARNPEKKFSLIAVEPCGLEKYYAKYPEMRPVR